MNNKNVKQKYSKKNMNKKKKTIVKYAANPHAEPTMKPP